MEYTNISKDAIEMKLKDAAEKVEVALKQYFKDGWAGNTVLSEAMQYSLLGGGKRIRAFLVLEFCRLFGGTEKAAMPYACALEMVHAYSLIHDDLPCMDNDPLRRGKPSCWKAFGETTALLAGDGLLTKAFETAADCTAPPERALAALQILAQSAGDTGMLGGQVIDLEYENRPMPEELLVRMYGQKTGALLRAAVKIGCVLAGADENKIFFADQYAQKIGLAFQIVDDILDVTGNEQALGKPIGSDKESGKTTFVTLYSLEEAQKQVEALTDEARRLLDKFAWEDEFLCTLTDRLAVRKN